MLEVVKLTYFAEQKHHPYSQSYLFLSRLKKKASWKHRHDMIATHFPFP